MATVFLSHAGADTSAANLLRKRLEAAGFEVWFDKLDLRAGRDAWQKQIEKKIEKVDAFIVYVGTRGVVNWVEAETRYAISRAVSGTRKLAFVPVLSPDVEKGSKALPGFARQFQAVRDPLNDPVEWNKLVDGLTTGAPPSAEKEPFVGLESITHDRSHLFFGRRNEIGRIVDILTDRNLLLVVGDSGAGKSSLVRAGLIPAWQGNEIGLRRGEHPGERDWLTITMKPGDDPWLNLARAIKEAAEEERGMSATEAAEYFDLAKREDPDHKMRAMRLNADPSQARVLLVVDQFEELFVRKAILAETRRSFAAFLATLSKPTDPHFAVALTMRGDYSNYLNEPDVAPLKERIEANKARARYFLRSILLTDPNGDANKKTGADRLREVVTGPLALARVPEDEANALADLVLGDTGGAPSDLALVQFALCETWEASGAKEAPDPSKLSLLSAYVSVGRVEGALAKAADNAVNSLIQADIATEENVWAALIRLGSLEGASPLRRTAQRAEFTDSRWAAIQYLASQEGRRLVHIAGEGDHATAEIAHEALLTQWALLNQLLAHNSEDKRLLDSFVLRVREAKQSREPQQPSGRLSSLLRASALQPPDPDGPVLSADDARRFERLGTDRRNWLTELEVELLRRSSEHAIAVQRREALRPKVMLLAVVVLAGLLTGVGALWRQSIAAQEQVRRNEAAALAGLAEVMIERNQGARAAILALAAMERGRNSPDEERIASILDASIALNIGQSIPSRTQGSWIFDFTPDGNFLVAAHDDGRLRLWSIEDFTFVRETVQVTDSEGRYTVAPTSVDVSSDGSFVAAGYADGQMKLWNLPELNERSALPTPIGRQIEAVAISGNGRIIAAQGSGGRVKQWTADTFSPLAEGPSSEEVSAEKIQYSDDDRFVVFGDEIGFSALMLAENGAIVEIDGERVAEEILVSKLGLIIRLGPGKGHSSGDLDLRTSDNFELIGEVPSGSWGFTTAVAVSPAGDRVISGDDQGVLRLYSGVNLASLEVVGEALAPIDFSTDSSYVSIAFSPDGHLIASYRRDDSIWIWDAETLSLLGPPIRGHRGGGWDMQFSPDGNYLISATNGGPKIWSLSRGGSDRISRLCDRLMLNAADEIANIEAEYGLVLPLICSAEQRAIRLPPLYVPISP